MKTKRLNKIIKTPNTWINEFGDKIIFEYIYKSHVTSYIATYKPTNVHETFNSLLSAKKWLNRFRKAKKWTSIYE